MHCEFCDSDSWIPAGISKKTGNPYKAFCSNKSCVSNNLTKESGFKKEIREIKEPFDKNYNMMVLSYAKDLVVAQLEKGLEFTEEPIDTVLKYYKYLKENL